LVQVNGRLLRAPTTQTRIISKRRLEDGVAAPTRQEAEMLGGLVSIPEAMRMAA
jgi:hypothetical protein